ncbi:MAG TPA: endo-1,4-beta-xylanase [Bacteroidales bacterium]|nr:endo-1,4-beta-xylanase [Bacteroidales bacterium]
MKSHNLCALAILSLFAFISPDVSGQSQTVVSPQQVLDQAAANVERYRKDDVKLIFLDANGEPLKKAGITVNQETHDFLFGALAFDLVWDEDMTPEQEKVFKERFSHLFNYAIFPFYWGAYEPAAGHPRWQRMEPQLAWCLENGITPKGHPLAWTNDIGLPGYIMDAGLEESEKLLEARIYNNVEGFKKEIQLWDVVNEPVNTVNWEMAHSDTSEQHRYTTDVPLSEIEPWVENAYKTAYKANPDAHFVLNEFKQIADTAVRKRFYDLVKMLLDKRTPISGLGIQAHEPRAEWFNPVDIWKTFEMYSDFGLPLHITEFSPRSGGAGITGTYKSGTWTPQTQAECAEMMYRLAFGHPSVVSVNWWGFSDKNSWLPGGGFVTDEYEPKPAYKVLDNLINHEWMTKDLHETTDRKGNVSFRGFFGQYDVMITTKDGIQKHFSMHVSKDQDNTFVFRLK